MPRTFRPSAPFGVRDAKHSDCHSVCRGGRVSPVVDDLAVLIASGQRFATIYADPPWSYGNKASRGAADNHYATMSLGEIGALPIGEVAAPDAHLHLWATNAFLREAIEVMEAWGFAFKSCFVWVKPQLGMGNYWRVSHEFLLFGLRGKLTFNDRSVRSWIEFPRTVHSRKPAVIRTLVEQVSPGPYLELFGRDRLATRDWTVFGDQLRD